MIGSDETYAIKQIVPVCSELLGPSDRKVDSLKLRAQLIHAGLLRPKAKYVAFQAELFGRVTR